MMTMRAHYIPEESRATIINIFRIPLNLFVCIILYNVRRPARPRPLHGPAPALPASAVGGLGGVLLPVPAAAVWADDLRVCTSSSAMRRPRPMRRGGRSTPCVGVRGCRACLPALLVRCCCWQQLQLPPVALAHASAAAPSRP